MKKCEIIKGGAAQSHYHHVPSQSPTCFFGRKGADGHADTHFWGTHSYNSYLCFKTCLRLTRTVRTLWLSNPHTSPYCSYCRIHHIPICLHIKRLDYIIYLELPNTSKYWILNSKPKKRSILGVGVEKRTPEWFLPFLTLRTFWSGKKRSKSVQIALKNRSKPFVSLLELKKAFWSGNSRSGVLFLLNLAKLIDFGFGVEISTIKRIQVYIIAIKRCPAGRNSQRISMNSFFA